MNKQMGNGRCVCVFDSNQSLCFVIAAATATAPAQVALLKQRIFSLTYEFIQYFNFIYKYKCQPLKDILCLSFFSVLYIQHKANNLIYANVINSNHKPYNFLATIETFNVKW